MKTRSFPIGTVIAATLLTGLLLWSFLALERRPAVNGPIPVIAPAPALRPVVTSADAAAGAPAALSLRLVCLRGRAVERRSDRKAVSGATIRATLNPPAPAMTPVVALTAADGAFTLPGLTRAASLRLEVDAESFALEVVTFELGEAAAGTEVIEIDVGEVPVDPGHTLVVHVAGPGGVPVQGAQVELTAKTRRARDELRGLAKLAESPRLAVPAGTGEYETRRLPPGFYRLDVSAPGLTAESHHVKVPQGQPVQIRLDANIVVTGTVVSPDKQPLAGARVYLEKPNVLADKLKSGGSCETDAQGRFTLAADNGHGASIVASAAGYAETHQFIPASGESILVMVFPEAGLEGQVVDAHNGQPIADARVHFVDRQGGSRNPWGAPEAMTVADGRFVLRKIGPEERTPAVFHPDYELELLESRAFLPGEWERGIVVRMRRGSAVQSGQVIDALTAAPIVAATVEAFEADQNGLAFVTGSAKSQADGSFGLRGLSSSTHRIAVSSDGYHIATKGAAELTAGAPCLFRLLPLGSLEGRVIDADGRPLAGIEVYLDAHERDFAAKAGTSELRLGDSWRGSPTFTDRDGHYRFREVVPYSDYILFIIDDELPCSEVQGIGCGPGQTVTGVDINVAPGSLLRGLALFADGSPAAGARITAYVEHPTRLDRMSQNDFFSRRASTQANGTFLLDRLDAGTWGIEASLDGHGATPWANVEVGEGAAPVLTLQFPGGESVTGIVLEDTSRPLEAVEVTANDGTRVVTTATASDGSFAVHGLARGPTQLKLQSRGHRSDARVIEPPVRNLRLTLVRDRRATVVGRLHSPGRDVLPEGFINVRDEAGEGQGSAVSNTAGWFELSPGYRRYSIHVRVPGFAETTVAFDFTAGEPTALDVELAPAASLEVRLVAASSGLPVTGAQVLLAPIDDQSNPRWSSARYENTHGGNKVEWQALPPGLLALRVLAPGFRPHASDSLFLNPGTNPTLVVELESAPGIVGRIYRKNVPLASLPILARHRMSAAESRATTAQDGAYEILDLPAGPYDLLAGPIPGVLEHPVLFARTELKEGSSVIKTVSLDQRTTFGRVTRAGAAVPGAKVFARHVTEESDEYSAQARHDGGYELLLWYAGHAGDWIFRVEVDGVSLVRLHLHVSTEPGWIEQDFELGR